MRRFDAGVGGTDSHRLIDVKRRLHFDTLPTLFDALLACEDLFTDCRDTSDASVTPTINKAGTSSGQSDELDSTLVGVSAILEAQAGDPSEYVKSTRHILLNILLISVALRIWRQFTSFSNGL